MAKDERMDSLRKRVAQAPTEPGIYKWLDGSKRVLYVGKAKNLRKRLQSYVRKNPSGPWQESFQEHVADFDVTVTTSDLEALLLETNLIKQLKPKYNVLMKDDKSYLFIRISLQDDYPTIETIRRYEQDGSKFFGPYLNSAHVYQTLDMLHEVLGYRACKQSIAALNKGGDPSTLKPCLEHQIGRCNGLCAGKITREEYRKRIDDVISFLKGNDEDVKRVLRERMEQAARDKKFELAAKLRNYLHGIEGAPETQVATDTTGEDSDIFGVAVLSRRAHVVILHRRDGRLSGESHFALHGQAESVASVLEQFLPQYYDEGREIPQTVIIPEPPPEDGTAMGKLLTERRKRKVQLIIPERGRKSRLLQLAERNAREKARQMELKWEAEEKNVKSALEELNDILKLPALPKRIEGYDISHLGGTETVGSMVVMQNAKPKNADYRSFTIRTLKSGQVDDYKALKEVLRRRFRRLTEDLPAEEKKWNAEGITFGRAVKKEQKVIEEIHAANARDLNAEGIDYKIYTVARKEKEIVGFARLINHPQGIREIKSVWVKDELRGNKLGQFIVRKILRSVKKGKVYVMCNPPLEEYYVEIGFRHVISPPKVLAESTAAFVASHPGAPLGVIMMWEAHQNKVDPSLTARPDLIVVDGGKGQLSSAVEVLKDFTLDIPVIGLAKREEEVFVPGQSDPVTFPPDSPAKFLLMRLRDEAHRFSNRHREQRLKHAVQASAFDEIPGIGEETKKKLLVKFGSYKSVQEATDDELSEILTRPQLESLRAARTL